MPEIKNQFTGGKMNKDLDERLIPKGQYRHAINVQVSTSEDSDVGTVQNILGNAGIDMKTANGLTGYTCVGSISDEKLDSSYWFLAGEKLSALQKWNKSNNPTKADVLDYIIQQKNNQQTIVFTDQKTILARSPSLTDLNSQATPITSSIDFATNKIYVQKSQLVKLSLGDKLLGIFDSVGVYIEQDTTIKYIQYSPSSNSLKDNFILVDNVKEGNSNFPNYLRAPNTPEVLGLDFQTGALNFDKENQITGINIIDDILAWTDSVNEPKMLNINNCISGTSQNGVDPTKLVNDNITNLPDVKVFAKDINVIKRKPTKKIDIKLSKNKREGVVNASLTSYSFANANGIPFEPGYQGSMSFSGETSFLENDLLLLLNNFDSDDGSRILPFEYDVKLIIKSISFSNGNTTIDYEIVSISSSTPQYLSDYSIILDQPTSSKFEDEMMRFSYRYRYVDKEVSALAPFTDVVFEAGSFLYNQKNAANYGMINNITEVILTNFIDVNKDLSIESVDLLVKYEGSPLIYIIDTLNRKEFASTAVYGGQPFDGSYNFNPQTTKGVLPENQLLRTWDAVPTTAKSQEVVGNRIVYGNYTFSNDFSLSDYSVSVSPTVRRVNTINLKGNPSVKSKRNYQVGLVLLDEEGRESPVFSNSDSAITLSKSFCGTSNAVTVTNNTIIPSWAKSYKYYIKDSSLPAYNIVVDAFYRAENGDFWIAVPSSERNKVEEGDFLELKKGINSDTPVDLDLTTKAISVKNEAPDFIKVKYRSLGSVEATWNDGTDDIILFANIDAIPQPGVKSFKISKDSWMRQHNISFGGGGDLTEKKYDDLFCVFTATPSGANAIGGVYRSKRYSATCSGFTGDAGSNTDVSQFNFRLEEAIKQEDSWINYDNLGVIEIEPTLRLEVFEKIILPNADFEGKFFIKIEAKESLIPNIAPSNVTNGYEKILKKAPIYNFTEAGAGAVNGNLSTLNDYTLAVQANTAGSGTLTNTTQNSNFQYMLQTYEDWDGFIPYSDVSAGVTVPTFWFIDGLSYKKTQNDINSGAPATTPTNPMRGLRVFKGEQYHITPNIAHEANYMGAGNFVKPDRFYMEVSLVGMLNNIEVLDVSGGWDTDYTRSGQNTTATLDTDSENLEIAGYLKNSGQKWKWEGGNEVFTILDTRVEARWNYQLQDEPVTNNNSESAVDQLINLSNNQSTGTQSIDEFLNPLNRRLTFILELDKNPLAYTDSSGATIDPTDSAQVNSYLNKNMVFIEQNFNVEPGEGLRTSNPAVFESEKQEENNLDIYYEASKEIPVNLDPVTLEKLLPVGTEVFCDAFPGLFPNAFVDNHIVSNDDLVVKIETGFATSLDAFNASNNNADYINLGGNSEKLSFRTPDGDVFTFKVKESFGIGVTTSMSVILSRTTIGDNLSLSLNWFNCMAFGNGVESVYLKDSFNNKFFNKGVKVSASLEGEYKKEHKKNGLIYSGLYNDNSETNNLNQFIQAEKITKDINPTYGSIQKLFTRNSDLVVFCEDKVLRVLANKDAVFNADGNSQLTATNNVLGQSMPFIGEYGISTNPESFASESYRAYFTDKSRGKVLRLSKDGLTPISDHGMKDYFRDNLKLNTKIIGSYDDKKDEYNVTLPTTNTTVSFKEDVRGWVSFKTFVPENAISCNNEYYTAKEGKIWKHHDEVRDRNTFYNDPLAPSEVEVIFNDAPSVIKSFKTINYEGSKARVEKVFDDQGVLIEDNQYYNLADQDGWYVSNAYTDLETGSLVEFIEKEDKWFGHIVGDDVNINQQTGNITGNFNTSDFSIQGVGTISTSVASVIYGCTDPTMFNYNASANNQCNGDNSCCVSVVLGCIDPTAANYSLTANTDNGQCQYSGCMNGGGAGVSTCADATGAPNFYMALNFDPNATVDDGSCVCPIVGCTQSSAVNYDPNATAPCGDNTANGGNDYPLTVDFTNQYGVFYGADVLQHAVNYCCEYEILGCTDINADNHNNSNNVDDGSCLYSGCTDPFANNFTFVGSQVDSTNNIFTYLAGTAVDDGSCIYPTGCIDPNACNYDNTPGLVQDDPSTCGYCADPLALNYDPNITCANTNLCEYCQAPDFVQVTPGATSDTIGGVDQSNGTAYVYITPSSTAGVDFYQIILNGNYSNPIMVDATGITGVITHELTGLSIGSVTVDVISDCGTITPGVVSTAWSGGPLSVTTLVTPILGCTDNTGAGNTTGTNSACNYNALANTDDGSCEYISCTGCTDINFLEYCGSCWDAVNQVVVAANANPPGGPWIGDDGSCATAVVFGCTDATQFNYDPLANTDDGSCIAVALGCTDDTSNNNGSDACSNFDPLANTDDGTCAAYNCPNSFSGQAPNSVPNYGTIGNLGFSLSLTQTPYPIFTGAPLNMNFEYDIEGFDNANASVTQTNNVGIFTGFVNPISYQIRNYSIDPSTLVADPSITSIELTVRLQTLPINTNSGANTGGNCTQAITTTYTIGCTDSNADSSGTFDISDNTRCVYTGCMLDTAYNYNPNSTTPCNDNGTDNDCCDWSQYQTTAQWNGTGTLTQQANQDSKVVARLNHVNIPLIPTTTGVIKISQGWRFVNPQNSSFGSANAYGNNITNQIIPVTPPGFNMNSSLSYSATTMDFSQFYDANGSPLSIPPSGFNTRNISGNGTVTVAVQWTAIIYKDSSNTAGNNFNLFGAILSHSYTETQQTFTVGCKTPGNWANYDATLDINIPSMCITPIQGCQDPNATNFEPNWNVDCAGNLYGTDGSCCCYGCNAPTALSATEGTVITNAITGTNEGVEFVTLNWTPSLLSIVDSIDIHYINVSEQIAGNLPNQTPEVYTITSGSAIANGTFDFAPPVTPSTPYNNVTGLGHFVNGDRYAFYLVANCPTCGTNNTVSANSSTVNLEITV